jgi:hypothetical protein
MFKKRIMNQITEDRIELIKGFKTTLIDKGLSIETRIKRLRIAGIFAFGSMNLLLILLVIISFITILHVEPLASKWNQSSMLVFMTITVSMVTHFSFVEFLLTKHLKKLQERNFDFSKELNIKLKDLIENMNENRLKPYWIKIPAIVVLIATLAMLLLTMDTDSINPEFANYWNLFPLPVFLISLMLFWNLNSKIIAFRKNINEVESTSK